MATAVRYNGPHTEVTVRGSDGVLYTCGRGQQVTVPDDTAAALFAEGWTAPDGSTPGYTPPISHVIEDVFLDNGVLSKQGSGGTSTPVSAGSSGGVRLANADDTGVTDATTAFQQAFSTALADNDFVVVPPGTFTVSDRLHTAVIAQPVRMVAEIPGSVVIQRTVAVPLIDVAGSKSATVALSADAAAGATTLTVASLPAGGLVAGDHVELASNVAFASGVGATAATIAEIARVQSVTGTGPYTITLFGPLDEAYAVANASTIARVDFAGAGSILDGIAFRQTAQNRDDATFPLVSFAVARDVQISRAQLVDADVPGIQFKGVVSSDIDRCRFENLTDNIGAGFIGYGINLGGNCRDLVVTRPIGRAVRHVVTTGWGTGDVGVPRHILVAHGRAFETSAGGWNTHKEGKFITFDSCQSHGDKNYGFYVRSKQTTIVNPTIVNPGAGAAVAGIKVAETEATDCLIRGGRIALGPNSFSGVQTDSPRTTVEGTYVAGPGGNGSNFRVEATATDSAFIDVRSKDPFGGSHINYATGSGTNHLVQGGFFNSSIGGKAITNATAGQVRISGGPFGTSIFPLDANARAVTDNQATAKTVSANYTISDQDRVILVDATGAARTVTLPTPANIGAGREFIVKKKDASANAVTVAGTIDGAVNASLAAQYDAVHLVTDGSAWFKV